MEVESVPVVPVVEETRVPEPARAGDEGAAAAAMAPAVQESVAPENMEPVVELPLSSDEYGDLRDIDPTVATSAANRIVEFISASEEILGAEMFEGLGDEDNWVIARSGAPSDLTHAEREEDGDWRTHVIPSDFADAEREEGDA